MIVRRRPLGKHQRIRVEVSVAREMSPEHAGQRFLDCQLRCILSHQRPHVEARALQVGCHSLGLPLGVRQGSERTWTRVADHERAWSVCEVVWLLHAAGGLARDAERRSDAHDMTLDQIAPVGSGQSRPRHLEQLFMRNDQQLGGCYQMRLDRLDEDPVEVAQEHVLDGRANNFLHDLRAQVPTWVFPGWLSSSPSSLS
eukprot:1407374-Rhodomonas_salina.1